jgi:cyclic-di-GMP phosphodiesterase, flagellum assembly factor TipF
LARKYGDLENHGIIGVNHIATGMTDTVAMSTGTRFTSLLSGPSILASFGILTGGFGTLLVRYKLVALPDFTEPLALSVAASAIICALAWVIRTTVTGHRRRLAAFETALSRTQLDLAALRHQSLPNPDTAPADGQQHVAAELRLLQQLLLQVVERRNTASSLRPAATPALRLVQESDIASPSLPEQNALAIMRSALEDSRIDLHLQPMVKLPNRRITHYEAFSRVRDEQGTVIFPKDYLRPAETAGLIGTLDNLLLFRCITLIRNLGPRKPGTKLFVNLALGSLRDSEFLGDFAYFMGKNEELAERLVFEIAATDLVVLDAAVFVQLAQLAKSGFGFSIDLGQSMDLPDDIWRAPNIKYVKLRAACLAAEHNSFAFDRLRAQLRAHKAALIATHIEEERDVIDVLDIGVDFGQGYLFGKPRLAREDLTISQAA